MRILRRLLFAVLCLVVFAAGTVLSFAITAGSLVTDAFAPLQVDWNDSVGQVHRDLSYGEGVEHTYDLYTPASAEKGKTYPLILLIHGGSFTGGSKEEGDAWGKFFASKGCVLATINYSLMGGDRPVSLADMYQETRDAVQAICSDSAELGYPLSEMAVTGTSAGATLALMYAFQPPVDAPLPIRFAFEQSGPVSFAPSAWGGKDTAENPADVAELAAAASGWTGQTITEEMVESGEYMEYVDAVSPVTFVNEQTVPVLLAYGDNDKIVPPTHREMLLQALEVSHVPHDFFRFSHSGHGLLGDPEQMEAYVAKILEYAETYFQSFG